MPEAPGVKRPPYYVPPDGGGPPISTTTKTPLVGILVGDGAHIKVAEPSDIPQDTTHRTVSDTEKSTWNSKEPGITTSTPDKYYCGDKTWQSMPTTLPSSDVYPWAKGSVKPAYTASEVGLGSVNNTSDSAKPVSTAQATAIALKQAVTQEGWITPTLLNSWVNFGTPYAVAAYMKDTAGFVHIKGMVKSGTMGASQFVLPVGYRPAEALIFAVSSGSVYGDVWVDTSGVITSNAGTNTWICYGGITFRAA